MAMRKGTKVRYIGDRYDYAKGQVFTVQKKVYGCIELYFPEKYPDGSIRRRYVSMWSGNFKEV